MKRLSRCVFDTLSAWSIRMNVSLWIMSDFDSALLREDFSLLFGFVDLNCSVVTLENVSGTRSDIDILSSRQRLGFEVETGVARVSSYSMNNVGVCV